MIKEEVIEGKNKIMMQFGEKRPKNSYIFKSVLLILVLIGFCSVPFVGSGYITSLIASIFVAGVLAASWNLMAGFLGYVSFGHQVFFGIGAYSAAILVTSLNLGQSSFIPSIILGGIVCSVVAFVFGLVALVLRGPYFSILTLGFSELMYVIMVNTPWFGGAEGLNLPPVYLLPKYYFTTFIIFIGMFIFLFKMRNSKFGFALNAIRQDEDAAEASGIPTHLYKVLAFAIAAFFPGLIGAAYVWYITYIDAVAAFQLHMVVEMIAITMFGGLGTVIGPLIGAFVFILIQEVLWSNFPELYLVFLGIIIVGMIQFMPQGVMVYIFEKLKIKIF